VADKQGVFRLKTLNNLLAMVIVMSVMGPGLTYGKQTSMRKEIERLSSLDPVERAAAVKGLGRIADPRAVEPLIHALRDEDPQVRKNAVTALKWTQDPRAVEPLIGVLKDEVQEVREGAVQALGRLRDPRAVDPLIGVLRDWPSMYSVGRSLKEIGEPAVEPLIAALTDDNSVVRAAAAKALGSIEDPRAVEPLILALGDEDPQVRKNAVTALRWIQDPRAVEPLIGSLKDEVREVREGAVQALGRLRDPRAVDPLIGVLRDWPSMYSVGRSLKEIGEPAVEPLIAALADDDSAVRAAAAEALGSIEDPRAVEPLILALGDEDPQARKNAATALRWFRDPRAVGPLIGALKDEDKGVQREAAWALSKTAGIDFGKNSLEWLEWWEKNKETFLKKK